MSDECDRPHKGRILGFMLDSFSHHLEDDEPYLSLSEHLQSFKKSLCEVAQKLLHLDGTRP